MLDLSNTALFSNIGKSYEMELKEPSSGRTQIPELDIKIQEND